MKRMKNSGIFLAALIAGSVMAGCSDDMGYRTGEGRLYLSTSVSSDVKVISRDAAEDELNEKCIIWISNEKGVVRKYNGLNDVPADGIKLLGGSYVAEAWTGDSVSASWESKYFKARQPFTMTGGDVTVNLNCKIANVLASVNYQETVDEVLSDYTMTIGHDRGELTFEGRDQRKGYFMMPSTSTDLTLKFHATKLDGSEFTKEEVIKNVKPAHEYVVNVTYTPESEEVGGGYFTIEVDDTEIVIEETVTLVSAPSVTGYNYNLDETQSGEPGAMRRRSVIVKGACALKSVLIESEALTNVIGGPDVNLLDIESGVVNELSAAGINFTHEYFAETDNALMKINFEPEFLNSLEAGSFEIKVTATDVNNRTTSCTLSVSITNAPVSTEKAEEGDVWTKSATIAINILKDDVANPGIEYRAKGTEDWTFAPATARSYTITLTDLTPGTTYEYRAVADGFVSNEILSFTTEEAAQIPNGGFEDWDTSSKAYLICAPGADRYWDSGNHGSSTMNKNVTTPDSEVKHSGNYSAQLRTQFVGVGTIGKLAAGNAFVGEYLDTQGTDGVLGWGRKFTSRPAALKGYVKYEPAVVGKYTSANAPDIVAGENDKGIIYVALVDGSLKDYNGKKYPVIIKTKTSALFSKDDSNVIAYGEMVFDKSTGGMIEINIPLEYKRQNERPSYLVLVCSASKGGDYFAGADGSVMNVDDLEFVY